MYRIYQSDRFDCVTNGIDNTIFLDTSFFFQFVTPASILATLAPNVGRRGVQKSSECFRIKWISSYTYEYVGIIFQFQFAPEPTFFVRFLVKSNKTDPVCLFVSNLANNLLIYVKKYNITQWNWCFIEKDGVFLLEQKEIDTSELFISSQNQVIHNIYKNN